jgi:hypothetical protein
MIPQPDEPAGTGRDVPNDGLLSVWEAHAAEAAEVEDWAEAYKAFVEAAHRLSKCEPPSEAALLVWQANSIKDLIDLDDSITEAFEDAAEAVAKVRQVDEALRPYREVLPLYESPDKHLPDRPRSLTASREPPRPTAAELPPTPHGDGVLQGSNSPSLALLLARPKASLRDSERCLWAS